MSLKKYGHRFMVERNDGERTVTVTLVVWDDRADNGVIQFQHKSQSPMLSDREMVQIKEYLQARYREWDVSNTLPEPEPVPPPMTEPKSAPIKAAHAWSLEDPSEMGFTMLKLTVWHEKADNASGTMNWTTKHPGEAATPEQDANLKARLVKYYREWLDEIGEPEYVDAQPSAKVVELPYRNYLGNADIAAWLRLYADEVEAGKHGDLAHLVAVTETEQGALDRMQVGRPMDRARLVGLLEFTKQEIFKECD